MNIEERAGRWVDEDGNKIREHKHGHYSWHFVHTKHRPLRLDVDYPTEHYLLRSIAFKRHMIFSGGILKVFSPDAYERFKEELLEKYKIPVTGALVHKRGGPIEIYLDKALEDTTWLAYNHFNYEILNEEWKSWMRDFLSIFVFYLCHDLYYIHEILHRMWYWECSYSQNRSRDREYEEEIVDIISHAVNTYIYSNLFTGKEEVLWEKYRKMLEKHRRRVR